MPNREIANATVRVPGPAGTENSLRALHLGEEVIDGVPGASLAQERLEEFLAVVANLQTLVRATIIGD
jgi:hypothetical protein